MKRVLVVYSQFMLSEMVENLLAHEKDLIVLGTAHSNHMTVNFDEFRPNVIILDDSLRFSELNRLFSLLKDNPELRVMVINIQENRVEVYEKYEISIGKANDLVSAIMQKLDLPRPT